MPIGFLPTDVFDGILCPLDEGQPEESRIRLSLRAISRADSRRVQQLVREATAAKSEEDEVEKLHQALKIPIVGWQNVPYPFDDVGIDQALTPRQQYELAAEAPRLLFVAEGERKKSPSQPGSVAVPSSVEDPAAGVTTAPAPSAP